MSKSTPKNPVADTNVIATLPPDATVKALIVGIEEYQTRRDGALPKVDYARRDAEAFLETLRIIYGENLDSEVLIDNDATASNIKYQLHSFIQSLDKNDLFIFYYAGHGFHGQGGNRITAWDTHAHNIEGTTHLLREILMDPLQESECRRALAFVDACAAEFIPLVRSRGVISNFSKAELNDYLAATEYFAMFLSCSPKEKSYPSNALQHGIWTYYLLRALKGEAEEALGPDRHLTDHSLQDYLRSEVRRYTTKEMTIRGSQTPQALIATSGSFSIRKVPLPAAPVSETGDLSNIRIKPTAEFFEGAEEGKIQSLPGFRKGSHFVPNRHSESTDTFVKQLLAEKVQEHTQFLYEMVKDNFDLRSRDIQYDSIDGFGSIETNYFRYTAEARQSPRDPAAYQIVRKLELRAEADTSTIRQVDDTFSYLFTKLVIQTKRDFIDFQTLVDKLEDFQAASDGTVRDEPAHERVTYTAPNGAMIVFSVASGKIVISAKATRSAQALINLAQSYRFGLEGQSWTLLGTQGT